MSTPVKGNSGNLKFSSDAAKSLHKAAVALGTKGGSQSSPAKTVAVRENGKLSHK